MGWAQGHITKLRQGETVSFRPRGHSMAPKIESGQLCTADASVAAVFAACSHFVRETPVDGQSWGELVRALFHVLAAVKAPTRGLAYFVRQIWIAARADGASLGDMVDSLRPLPPVVTPAQAVLVLQFVGDRAAYTEDERACLKLAAAGVAWSGLSFDDVFMA
jgi:hypothetical protein